MDIKNKKTNNQRINADCQTRDVCGRRCVTVVGCNQRNKPDINLTDDD
jgi:hypothetical protein